MERVELRGWLQHVGSCNENATDPDFHYSLQVDTRWATDRGIDLLQLLRVGNIVEFGADRQRETDFRRVVATPPINIELRAWSPVVHTDRTPPSDWVGGTSGVCADYRWPFNPLNPIAGQPPLAVGQYVRVFGSLVTDHPHYSKPSPAREIFRLTGVDLDGGAGLRAAKVLWSGGRPESDPDNPARWTEVHPPDVISVLPATAPRETLRAVALITEACLTAVGCPKESVDFEVRPVGERPSQAARVAFVELVGPETNPQTLVPHDEHPPGAGHPRVVVLGDRIHVRVAVRGLPPGPGTTGVAGKFRALYRVLWAR